MKWPISTKWLMEQPGWIGKNRFAAEIILFGIEIVCDPSTPGRTTQE